MEKYVVFFISFSLQLIVVESNAKRTAPSVTLDIPVDFHQRIKVYDDFIKMVEAPSLAGAEFDVVLSYRTKDKRLLSFEVASIGIQHTQRSEFKYIAIVAHRTDTTQALRVKVNLRDSLAYLENKALNVFPDLYTEKIHITVMLLDVLPGGLESKPVLAGDFLQLPLVPPWRRPQKPGFCFPWTWKYVISISQQKIVKCQNLNGEFEAI